VQPLSLYCTTLALSRVAKITEPRDTFSKAFLQCTVPLAVTCRSTWGSGEQDRLSQARGWRRVCSLLAGRQADATWKGEIP
jgi:hypothetical protein